MQKINILLIDDEDSVYNEFFRYMEIHDLGNRFDMDHANSGLEGSERLSKKHYDVVLLDIEFPGQNMQGEDILRELKRSYPDLPVIMLSRHGDATRDALIEWNADDFVRKDASQYNYRAESFKRIEGKVKTPISRLSYLLPDVFSLPDVYQHFPHYLWITYACHANGLSARSTQQVLDSVFEGMPDVYHKLGSYQDEILELARIVVGRSNIDPSLVTSVENTLKSKFPEYFELRPQRDNDIKFLFPEEVKNRSLRTIQTTIRNRRPVPRNEILTSRFNNLYQTEKMPAVRTLHLVETFYQLYGKLKNLTNWPNTTEDWINLNTRLVVPFDLAHSEIGKENANLNVDITSLSQDYFSLRNEVNGRFANFVEQNYRTWRANPIRSPLVGNFLDGVFLSHGPFSHDKILIVIFDCMTVALWHQLRARMETAFCEHGIALSIYDGYMLSDLPSTTDFSRRALFAGKLWNELGAQTNEKVLFLDAIGERGYSIGPHEVEFITDFTHEAKISLARKAVESPGKSIVILVYGDIDQRVHDEDSFDYLLYRNFLADYAELVHSIFETIIEQKGIVFIASDHGYIKTRRVSYATFRHNEFFDARHFSYTSDVIDLPDLPASAYFRSPEGRWIIWDDYRICDRANESSTKKIKYSHGGCSLQEMVVPYAIVTGERYI